MHWVLAFWLWHPLGDCQATVPSGVSRATARAILEGCKGYNSWSGILSDIGEITIFVSILTISAAIWHRHNCHVHGCWRWSWHPNPETGHPECKVHHPDPHGYLEGSRHRRGRRLRIHLEHIAKRQESTA